VITVKKQKRKKGKMDPSKQKQRLTPPSSECIGINDRRKKAITWLIQHPEVGGTQNVD